MNDGRIALVAFVVKLCFYVIQARAGKGVVKNSIVRNGIPSRSSGFDDRSCVLQACINRTHFEGVIPAFCRVLNFGFAPIACFGGIAGYVY